MVTYSATNTKTGQFYIGSTINFQKRKQEHLGCKSPYPFQRSLRKNPEDWVWETWEDDEDERELEQLLLDLLWGTDGCLNLGTDATAPKKGLKQTPETKAKIGAKNKGKKYGPETRAKISAATKGHTRTKGRKFPGRNRGATNSQAKKVEVTFPSGERKVFDWANQAALELGCCQQVLCEWCRFEKTPSRGAFKGFFFKYL